MEYLSVVLMMKTYQMVVLFLHFHFFSNLCMFFDPVVLQSYLHKPNQIYCISIYVSSLSILTSPALHV